MATDQSKETIINDIVHGIIKLPDYIQEIIDTEQFQRLRYISQLSFKSFVYPSANYSRFEHSIGTFHLASKLIRQIKSQLDNEIPAEISVSDDEVKCVEIAALCHDLGHGPYSHFWEHAFDETIPTRKHEIISAEIFDELINSTKSGRTQSIKQEIHLSDINIDLVKRIISGRIDNTRDRGKFFLFEIVANKESGLDVDKFDYLCRDSIYLGWSNKNKIHDVKRIMHFLRVAKNGNDEWHLAMRDREIFNIHDVFYYRHFLHRYGYQHKTVKSIECLFKKAIKSIVDNDLPRNEFIGNVLMRVYNEYDANIWFSTEFIRNVCDHHVWEIMKKYKKDIVKQIQERKLYKLHCQIQVLPLIAIENNQNRNISDDVKALTEVLKQIPGIADIAVSQFSMQSENKGNPLLSVRFYKKTNRNYCFKLEQEDLPDLVELKSDEFIMMIFTETNEVDIVTLNRVTEILCSRDFNENAFDEINIAGEIIPILNNEIGNLRGNYKFRENKY